MEKPETINAIEWIEEEEKRDPDLTSRLGEQRKKLYLGIHIRDMREKAGYTQTELARRASTSQSMIARIEAGEQDNLKINTLLKIAMALGKDLDIGFKRLKQKDDRFPVYGTAG
ncbi:MAG: helix-turn-helix transcriptional regulator [Candidatus Electryonea clarkiae]|nr:helix-turn-helix transcriptional regulator [Candidatus Electryonea clarkiae]MDP8288102.1 helix-turn-helix transcriptional regulator [Candidatus Electryonea clarkiae]